MSFAENIEAYQKQFKFAKSNMEKELSKCTKLEKVLGVMYGGYFKREHTQQEKFKALVEGGQS